MRTYEVTPDDMKLIDEAYATLDKAKVPGNFFHTVGCCLKAKNGTLYHGVNCDCIHGSCAEFIAVGNAISDGCHETAGRCLWSIPLILRSFSPMRTGR